MRKGIRWKRICVAAGSILFYMGMLLLTVTGRAVHNGGLPKVRGRYPELFPFREGEETVYKPGLPASLKNQPVFQIVCREKNGEIRYFAKQITDFWVLETREDVFLVEGKVSSYQMIICEGMEMVKDGSEVWLLNEEELQPWN